ncbi:flavin reductase family protein [Microbacterium sp. F51-2R]|uniref:flavin reductase family protein n=1 Tax=Microbacterium sp. F51-2R TaxID=3445777 RepID=UPI003FA12678
MKHTAMSERRAGLRADFSALPTGVTPEAFKTAFRNHPAGVAVITAITPDGPVALTATSVVSVSAEPPILIFSLSALSSASSGIRAAETIVVHLLSEKDAPIARLCASSGIDRFADPMIWSSLTTGEPLFHGIESWLRCRIIDRMDAGGSTVVAAQAVQVSTAEPAAQGSPLVYHNRAWHRLGDHSLLP